MIELDERLAIFLEAGLLADVPTPWQIRQGELAMWPWVISTDVTDEARYQGAPLGHPLLRQPVIFAHVGLDHLRIGTGLRSSLDSVCTHLHFTYHRGMPVWDLQLAQTHPGGLAELRRRTRELVEGSTPRARRIRRRIELVLPDAGRYHDRFLGDGGWIDRAARFDYPTAEEAGAPMPEHFFSLAAFLGWVGERFPARVCELPAHRVPVHVAALATQRFRSGRGFGWFAA